jgi:hypothetical protein
MGWPLSQDYNEAIQNLHLSFADADLRTARKCGGSVSDGSDICNRRATVQALVKAGQPGASQWSQVRLPSSDRVLR